MSQSYKAQESFAGQMEFHLCIPYRYWTWRVLESCPFWFYTLEVTRRAGLKPWGTSWFQGGDWKRARVVLTSSPHLRMLHSHHNLKLFSRTTSKKGERSRLLQGHLKNCLANRSNCMVKTVYHIIFMCLHVFNLTFQTSFHGNQTKNKKISIIYSTAFSGHKFIFLFYFN